MFLFPVSSSRIAMTCCGEDGAVCTKWFMVLMVRDKESRELEASIRCYRDFPAVRVVVKQEDRVTGQVVEYEYLVARAIGRTTRKHQVPGAW